MQTPDSYTLSFLLKDPVARIPIIPKFIWIPIKIPIWIPMKIPQEAGGALNPKC